MRNEESNEGHRCGELQLKPGEFSVIRIFILITGLNLLMLLGTSVFNRLLKQYGENYDQASYWVRFGLYQFNLATENVLASWYSSMLLFLVATLCVLCCILDLESYKEKRPSKDKHIKKQKRFSMGKRPSKIKHFFEYWRKRYLSLGWLALGFMFCGLSADEMGSWHESILMLDFDSILTNGWMNLLTVPIGVVGLFMALFFWVHLRANKLVFSFMLIALGLYLSNPVLEHMELSLAKDGYTQLDIILWLEEGGELFGTMLFALAALLHARSRKAVTLPVSKSQQMTLLEGLSLGVLAAYSLCIFATNHMVRGDDGIPHNWFPATLFFFAGILAIVFLRKEKSLRWQLLSFAILLSAYYGANIRGWIYDNDELRLGVHLVLGLNAAWICFQLARREKSYVYWLCYGNWLLYFAYTFGRESSYAQWPDVIVSLAFVNILTCQLLNSDKPTDRPTHKLARINA